MAIIWENEPVKSGRLAELALERLRWKKSTVYTVLKKLVNKGAVKNENAVVTSLIHCEDVMREQSENIIGKCCGGSLPMFLTAFLGCEKLTREEAEELKKLIDKYTE